MEGVRARRVSLLEADHLALLVLAGLYLLSVVPRLADHPIVGGDEGWIISAAAKLAREGVFGSDLFAGFYGADEHYYFNLPLHHLILAGVFKLLGVGLLQARLVSVAYGLATLVLTYALGRRLGGPAVGVAGAALILVLRLNLTPFTGLSLTDLGATVRYDLVSLPYALGAVLLLVRPPETLPARRVALAGLLLGLAGLTQFIGAFFVLPLALFLLTAALPAARRFLLVGVLLAGAAAPFLPYGAYLLTGWSDFRGQARTTEQHTDLLAPSFYVDNLVNEPDRYALGTGLSGLPNDLRDLAKRPSARLALYLLAPLAAAFTLGRARAGSRSHWLLALLLFGLPLELALFESTKRFVYWVVVVPFLCVAIADLGRAVLGWRPHPANRARRGDALLARLGRPAALALTVVIAVVFTIEGLAVAIRGTRDALDAPSYAEVGRKVGDLVPAGARVIGDNRLWLTLEDRDERSLLLLFYLTNPEISRDRATDIAGAMERIDAGYMLISPLTREILGNLTPKHRAELDSYLAEHATLVGTVPDRAYGPIEVYRLAGHGLGP